MDPKDIKPGAINYVDQTPPKDKPRSYWMVHGGAMNQPSTVMHFSQASAEFEAKRLAEVNVGKPFFVLEALSVFQVTLPTARQSFLTEE